MDSAERILELVRDLSSRSIEVLQVYWHTIKDGRDAFCRDLISITANDMILPIVLRGDGFSNANCLLSDIKQLIEQHREVLSQPRFAAIGDGRPLVLVLLSRVELSVPQLSSPTVLPSWLPCIGGLECSVLIQDLARVADGPLNSPEAHIAEVCARLYAFDKVMVARLRQVHANDRRHTDALRSLLFPDDPKPERLMQFLDAADEMLSRVQNSNAYRPSLRESGCPSALLMRLFLRSTPDELTARAEAVKSALSLAIQPDHALSEPLCAVLFRPANVEKDASRRAARAMIITVYAACQFVTAAAHADDYPRFPLNLLRSQSYDLRSAIGNLIHLLG